MLLSPLSHDDLEAVYEDILAQYSQELALGALERSEWLCGAFFINANQGPICYLETALDVVGAEMSKRKAMMAGPATGLLN
jgi:hypothetical protein